VYLSDRVIVLDKNPGRIKQEIYINIPHWRDRESEEFIRFVDRIYSIMMGKPITANQADQKNMAFLFLMSELVQ